eukprot:358593-Chlamydomonas_euryale.AAC.8
MMVDGVSLRSSEAWAWVEDGAQEYAVRVADQRNAAYHVAQRLLRLALDRGVEHILNLLLQAMLVNRETTENIGEPVPCETPSIHTLTLTCESGGRGPTPQTFRGDCAVEPLACHRQPEHRFSTRCRALSRDRFTRSQTRRMRTAYPLEASRQEYGCRINR